MPNPALPLPPGSPLGPMIDCGALLHRDMFVSQMLSHPSGVSAIWLMPTPGRPGGPGAMDPGPGGPGSPGGPSSPGGPRKDCVERHSVSSEYLDSRKPASSTLALAIPRPAGPRSVCSERHRVLSEYVRRRCASSSRAASTMPLPFLPLTKVGSTTAARPRGPRCGRPLLLKKIGASYTRRPLCFDRALMNPRMLWRPGTTSSETPGVHFFGSRWRSSQGP